MTRIPHPLLPGRWQDRLDRFDRSGLTVSQFCQREGCSPASFYQWRRKLGNHQLSTVPEFVTVDLKAGDQHDPDDAHVQIQLPGGAVVKISGNATADQQRTLFQAILQATAEVDS